MQGTDFLKIATTIITTLFVISLSLLILRSIIGWNTKSRQNEDALMNDFCVQGTASITELHGTVISGSEVVNLCENTGVLYCIRTNKYTGGFGFVDRALDTSSDYYVNPVSSFICTVESVSVQGKEVLCLLFTEEGFCRDTADPSIPGGSFDYTEELLERIEGVAVDQSEDKKLSSILEANGLDGVTQSALENYTRFKLLQEIRGG